MEDNNGRVTLAVLKQTVLDLSNQIMNLTEQQEKTQDKIDAALKKYDDRLRGVEVFQAQDRTLIARNKDDIKGLSTRSNVVDGVVAVAVAIGSLLGISR